MRCPKCGDPHCKYEENWRKERDRYTGEARKRRPINYRTNFKAKCKKCGWSGEC